MTGIRGIIRRHAPSLVAGYRAVKRYLEGRNLRGKTSEDVFTDIYRNNRWGGETSVSGVGSDPGQTVVIRRELPRLARTLGVKILLDIPCGDFSWFSRMTLDGLTYIGADIVQEMVDRNRERYAAPRITFRHLNLLADALPKADLILCRDCLIHFSTEDVFRALANICESDSTYLLTTSFPSRRNWDIVTGQWRPINLQAPPFGLPSPLELINEEYAAEGGQYRDKSLGLWHIGAIREAVAGRAS